MKKRGNYIILSLENSNEDHSKWKLTNELEMLTCLWLFSIWLFWSSITYLIHSWKQFCSYSLKVLIRVNLSCHLTFLGSKEYTAHSCVVSRNISSSKNILSTLQNDFLRELAQIHPVHTAPQIVNWLYEFNYFLFFIQNALLSAVMKKFNMYKKIVFFL